jgi:hypothetical protein
VHLRNLQIAVYCNIDRVGRLRVRCLWKLVGDGNDSLPISRGHTVSVGLSQSEQLAASPRRTHQPPACPRLRPPIGCSRGRRCKSLLRQPAEYVLLVARRCSVGSAHRHRPLCCESRRVESLPRQCEFVRHPECQTSQQRRNSRWRFGLVTIHVAKGASVRGSLTPQNLGKVALPSDAIAASLIKPGSSVTKTSEIVPLSAT